MTDASTLVLSFFLATLLFVIILKFFKQKKYKLPPRPPGSFLLGNLKDFVAPYSHKIWANEYRKKYGDVILLNIVRDRAVIINDYNIAVESFVSKHANDLAGRPSFFLFRKISGGNSSIVMADFAPRYKLQRKLVNSALRNFMKGPTVEKLIERSFEYFQINRKSFGEGYFEPRIYLQQLFFNVICSALFGDCYDISDPGNYEVLWGLQELSDLSGKYPYLDVFPFLWHFPIKSITKIKQLLQLIHTFAKKKIKLHEECLSSEPRDITDCFLNELKSCDSSSQSLIDDDVVMFSLVDLMLAGTETSASTLYWLVGILACNPEIEERIYQEITSYRKTLPPGDSSVSISWRDHLPYTQATILEGIRYGNVVPRSLPRLALEDVKIGGYDVPKGSTVILNQFAFHTDPKLWKQPELFQPGRFLDNEGKVSPRPAGLTGFGLGRRICIGEAVAKADLFMLLVLLCSNYKFEWDPENEDSSIKECESGGLFGTPATYKVAFKQRDI